MGKKVPHSATQNAGIFNATNIVARKVNQLPKPFVTPEFSDLLLGYVESTQADYLSQMWKDAQQNAENESKTQTKLLNYPCDIYESESDGWANIIAVERGMGVILRIENKQNGKLVQIMEATEFRPEKPAAALFEIPAGYKRSE